RPPLSHRRTLSFFDLPRDPRDLPSFPTRRSSDLGPGFSIIAAPGAFARKPPAHIRTKQPGIADESVARARLRYSVGVVPTCCLRSEEHTSELQSRENLVCRLLLEKKKKRKVSQTE